ncbi:M20 metallopeptidase family protein [Thermohalobacter berrensis]|uniref:Peptidase M20 n=1 Tax=Thermohalobacter berrensis TaxID=99594 RepID=A0A419T4T6_9FIRM|nr:amidohydrolase [Thermohalobacter berrensis]RKD32449.1 peptidase M20 [Thermohalobacter berrensis]
MKKIIKEKINKYNKEFINLRRYFHQYPEIGYKEHKTSKKIAELLYKWGLEVKKGVADTGVVGLLKGKKSGKTIAVRADIDALPIEEKTNLEFASKNKGVMHACGHDGHITIGLWTAKVLSELKDKIEGNIKFIFQPAEEGPGGAERMIKEGVLEKPKVDAIIGLHIWPEIKSGYVGISKGPIMAAADRFDIKVIGSGGHGAVPHMSVDPIVVGSKIVSALQTLVSRETDPLDCLVISNCVFKSGDVFNVIPNEANLSGTVRTFNPEIRKSIPKRIGEIVEGITRAMRCKYEYKYNFYYPPTINNKKFTTFFEEVAKDTIGHDKVFELERPSMGGEDFSYYLKKIPGTFFFLGTKNEEKGINKPIHHPEYTFDEDILQKGTELFVNTVIKYLNN